MDFLNFTSLLVFTLGAFCYGMFVALWVRDLAGTRRRTMPPRGAETDRPAEFADAAICLASFIWFTLNLLQILISLNPEIRQWEIQSVLLFLAFLFPPLIMHTNFAEGRSTRPAPLEGEPAISRPSPAWRAWLVLMYVLSPATAVFCLLGYYRIVPIPVASLNIILNLGLGLSFTIAMGYSVLFSFRFRSRSESRDERRSRRWLSGLFLGAMAVFVLLVLSIFGQVPFHRVLELLARSMPLAFLFVIVYFENRFEFFDIFVKRGTALLLTIVLLTFWFALVLPWLEGDTRWFGVPGPGRLNLGWARPWVFAIAVLPAVLALPWLYRRMSLWLDGVWFGRRFTPVEAVKHFLASLQTATTAVQLAARAEQGIAAVFHAPVRIDLGIRPAAPLDFTPFQDIPIRAERGRIGTIRLGARKGQTPYFSQDLTLLHSLAEVFSYLLQNIRLQERQQEQERVGRELSLQASRSELKALRAQINPHFLFNALNAIAGLIHNNPQQADRTVEQLAEVFRYTLRRSESEWAVLEEELEFVRAYLEVEQARFGRRLQFCIDMEEGIGSARIPAMMIQTLVENAVKHGVASVRGDGRVEIDARRGEDGLRIEIADNGPGFGSGVGTEDRTAGAKGSGYGLRNIQGRLEGYFGTRAGLEIRRDREPGRTVVTLRLPLTGEADDRGTGGNRAGSRPGGAA